MGHRTRDRDLRQARRTVAFAFLLVTALVAGALSASAAPPSGNPATYTLDTHFSEGTLVNVNYDIVADQLQLDQAAEPFNFIWVAVSSKGTVVKIDTTTGAVLGEYRTTPSSQGPGNPSRTTVDNDGSVWVANRNNVSNGYGTVLHIGLEENGQCEDRNTNGVIDTSTGLGNILGWTDNSGARGVATAADECIVHYTQVNSMGTRHVSVDANNDVWVSGTSLRNFDLVDGGRYDVPGSGTIARSENSVGYGGYGGLIDGNGVIWSANQLLRWDTANPLNGPNGGNWDGYGHDSYGLCIDSSGNVWNTALFGNQIRKFTPGGTLLGTFAHGDNTAQGCVVDGNDHVWVAHSLLEGGHSVGHILNDGTFIGNVTVGDGPTGVAVDAAGKIWATNYFSETASRIDPTGGPTGADGVTKVGAVDFTTVSLGGNLYNYSDMTGSTLSAPPDTGAWTVVHDSGVPDALWSMVSWNADVPGDSSLVVKVASSTDGVTFGPEEIVTNGALLGVDPGQFLKVTVGFDRATTGESPVLYDITLTHECGPMTVNLIADGGDEYLDVGGVTIWEDGDDLKVEFFTDVPGWRIAAIHVDVADTADNIKQTKKHNPIPGKFEIKEAFDYPWVTYAGVYTFVGAAAAGDFVVAAHAELYGPAVNDADPDGLFWASELVASDQGYLKDGGDIAAARSIPASVLGPPDSVSPAIEFFSLGFGGSWTVDDLGLPVEFLLESPPGGSVEVAFDGLIANIDGDYDVSIHETTWGTYPLEQVLVHALYDGDLYEVGVATNVGDGITYLNLPEVIPYAESLVITDMTDPGLFGANGDGFDLDAVDAVSLILREETGWGEGPGFVGANWAMYIEYTDTWCYPDA